MRFQVSDIKLLHLLLRGIQTLKPTLKSLSIFLVYCKNMRDQDLRVFSSYIGKFTQLEAFEFSFDSPPVFSDKELLNLAAVISKLKSLRTLCLNFGGCPVVNTISRFFASLQKLQNLSDLSLNFSNCDLFQAVNHTTESITAGLMITKTLPIQKLTLHLSTLYHSSDDLSLSRILPQFISLKSLSLYFTKDMSSMPPRNQDLVVLLACLKEIPHLSLLTLSLENFTQVSAIVGNVGETLKFLTGLAQLKLNISGLNCSDSDMMNLCSGLEGLTLLKSLEMGLGWIRHITEKGVDALAKTLKKLVQVKSLSLNLNGNKFVTNEGFSNFLSSIKSLKNLAHLDLNFSLCLQLSYESIEELAEALETFDCLQSISLDFLGFPRLGTGQDIFQTLFEVLKKKQTIQDVKLTLCDVSFFGLYPPEVLKFKQRKNFSLD